MEKEITYGQVLSARKAFANIDEEIEKPPVSLGLWIIRNMRHLQGAYEDYQELHGKLFEVYAEEDEESPSGKRVPEDDMPDFREDVREILIKEVEVEISLLGEQVLDKLVGGLDLQDLSSVMYAIGETK